MAAVQSTHRASTEPESDDRARRLGWIAAGLLFVSAVLQGVAAAQRWIFAGVEVTGGERLIEDHLFDYAIPAEPWVSVGQAATLFGLGYGLIAASIICIGYSARRLRSGGRAIVPVSFVAALPFAFFAVHAVLSGAWATPSPLESLLATTGAMIFGVAQVAALVVLAALIVRRSPWWAVGLLLLTGTSIVGYIVALFEIAPMVVGYTSFDTTPWTEGVVAAWTALAAAAVLVGAARAGRFTRTR